MTAPVDPTAVFAWLNEQRLSEPRELHRRVTILEENMATVAEQAAELTALVAKIDADVTRLNDARAVLDARVADLEAQLAGIDPALAELLEPVKAAAAALDARTPEPEAPVV